MFVTAITKIQFLLNLLRSQFNWVAIIAIFYFASVIIAFIGMLRLKICGFIAAYVHILTATFFSISVLPFYFKLIRLGHPTATIVLIIINLTVLLLIALAHLNKKYQLKKISTTS